MEFMRDSAINLWHTVHTKLGFTDMWKSKTLGRAASKARGIAASMGDVFCLWPSGDYRRLHSRSAEELSNKAWSMTGDQMHSAVRTVTSGMPEHHVR